MGISNIMYASTIIFKGIISNTFENTFDIFPLTFTSYPFTFFQIELFQNVPGNKLRLLVDCWNNSINKNEFVLNCDKLADSLDFKSRNEAGIHLSGELESYRYIPTQEENLEKYQIIALYDVYKSN